MSKISELKVYNTLSGKKEVFVSQQEKRVGMYVCGPTTYNYIHLGNARPLVVFDTVRRYLEYLGYEVTYVQNFTDVDDKIIKKAQEENEPPLDLSARYVAEYFKDAGALNVRRASVHPQVSQHIPEIINFVQVLVAKGYAYEIAGDVYFSVSNFTAYGKLSKRDLADLQAGARVEVAEQKKQPGDFALWKKAKPGEPSWSSPWGEGRPGWHIECSAMSHKYLGKTFDIHAGGMDLIFPHHENEIAQSEAYHGVPMAHYWLHNGFITVNQEKMSKSLGNFFMLRDILQKFSGQVIRFYLLSTHYRSPLDFDDEKLGAAQKGLERLQTAQRLLEEALREDNGSEVNSSDLAPEANSIILSYKERFLEAMNDDFNTALAIAVLFDLAHSINALVTELAAEPPKRDTLRMAGQIFQELAGILGLELAPDNKTASGEAEQEVDELITQRQEARLSKNFKLADALRDQLKEMGVILEDTPRVFAGDGNKEGYSLWVYPSKNPKELSSLVLAYVGDAVFELYVRMYLVAKGGAKVNGLNKEASSLVRASSQADFLQKLEPLLSDEERDVARRGRNAKSGSVPKNADIVVYRISTGFEALIGYLFLVHREERIKELLDRLFKPLPENQEVIK